MLELIFCTQMIYRITSSYGRSHINAGSHLVAGVKHNITKLSVQGSALLVISCLQNSHPASNKCRSCLVAGVEKSLKRNKRQGHYWRQYSKLVAYKCGQVTVTTGQYSL